MRSKTALIWLCVLAALLVAGQQSDVIIKLSKGERAAIALPDLRGAGEAQRFMDAFNRTVWGDIESSGLFKMAPKSLYPLEVPQRPEDFRPPLPAPPARRGQPPPAPRRQGPWLTDWSGPPVNAGYLAFGYAAEQAGQFVVRGWLYNVAQQDVANAQVFGKLYLGSLNEEGARKTAHEFAADILQQFGGTSLAGTKICFVSDRAGRGIKEIWWMDPDGANQKPITNYRSVCTTPGVSPDGTKIAFTSYVKGNPAILLHSLETGRQLRFYGPVSSMVATPEFTPDGQKILFSYTIDGWPQIAVANVDGSNLRRISYVRAIEVEPKVNPKTGAEVAFVSGRAGFQQIFRMNLDGSDVRQLTPGEGLAANPSWHPDGQHIAFVWSKGYAPGHFNIFVMDVATRTYVQLTHGAGRNENPTWAPDGRHIVFSSTRGGSTQIYTMLADGTQVRQLTTQGRNTMPVWSK